MHQNLSKRDKRQQHTHIHAKCALSQQGVCITTMTTMHPSHCHVLFATVMVSAWAHLCTPPGGAMCCTKLDRPAAKNPGRAARLARFPARGWAREKSRQGHWTMHGSRTPSPITKGLANSTSTTPGMPSRSTVCRRTVSRDAIDVWRNIRTGSTHCNAPGGAHVAQHARYSAWD